MLLSTLRVINIKEIALIMYKMDKHTYIFTAKEHKEKIVTEIEMSIL